LARLVGHGERADLSGRRQVRADEAHAFGILDRVVRRRGRVDCVALGRRARKGAVIAMGLAKRDRRRSRRAARAGSRPEADALVESFGTDDAHEGVESFL
jgi:enoyl-CoA hydratase/carnithine racemase